MVPVRVPDFKLTQRVCALTKWAKSRDLVARWNRTSAGALQSAPAAGAIVRNDVLEYGGERRHTDRFTLMNGHGAGRRVVMTGGDDALGIRDDGAVVEKDVHVLLRCHDGADVALEDEVRTVRALDGFGHLGVGGVDQFAGLAADGLLPTGQRSDVGVNARVGGVCHDGLSIAASVNRVCCG